MRLIESWCSAHIHGADFFIDHRLAYCRKEEDGEREKDSWKDNRGGMSEAQEARKWHAPRHFPLPSPTYQGRWKRLSRKPPPCTPSPLGQFGTQVEDLRDGLCMQVMNRKTDIWQ